MVAMETLSYSNSFTWPQLTTFTHQQLHVEHTTTDCITVKVVVLFVMELHAHPGGAWLHSYCAMGTGTLVATSRLHAHLGRCGCTLKLLGTLIATFRLHVLGEGLHLQQQASPGKMSKNTSCCRTEGSGH